MTSKSIVGSIDPRNIATRNGGDDQPGEPPGESMRDLRPAEAPGPGDQEPDGGDRHESHPARPGAEPAESTGEHGDDAEERRAQAVIQGEPLSQSQPAGDPESDKDEVSQPNSRGRNQARRCHDREPLGEILDVAQLQQGSA